MLASQATNGPVRQSAGTRGPSLYQLHLQDRWRTVVGVGIAVQGAIMVSDNGRIRPYAENPFYWQYQGKPVMLLGGSREDNLFQIPGLDEHLDLLARVGGNYIRNTMDDCDEGDVKAFHFDTNASKYNLDLWNEEYWKRLDHLLEATKTRNMIVQVEVWPFHDVYHPYWSGSPWNPANNINYTATETILKSSYGQAHTHRRVHDFWDSVPALRHDRVLLRYQQRFVDKLLNHTLAYDHVLYTMTNEIHAGYSPEWGWYWSRYISDAASARGKTVETSEMYWQTDLTDAQHLASLHRPDVYSFFEASQNSVQNGELHWSRLQHVRKVMLERKQPRPINQTKIYGRSGDQLTWTGSTEQAIERFWRGVLGGAASVRFHRDECGLGLLPEARASIRAMRRFTDAIPPWQVSPRLDLLPNRADNGAYLMADPGRLYGLYFTDGGSVALDLSSATGLFALRWISLSTGEWYGERTPLTGGSVVTITAPGRGGWAAAIVPDAGE